MLAPKIQSLRCSLNGVNVFVKFRSEIDRIGSGEGRRNHWVNFLEKVPAAKS